MHLNPFSKVSVSVLAAIPGENDRAALQKIFSRLNWPLTFADNYDDLSAALAKSYFGATIVEADLGEGHDWKEVVHLTGAMTTPIPVIVTDRLADEFLWAEVLNLGGYDLLLKPFDPTEVCRVVTSAWLSWHRQCELAEQRNQEGDSLPESTIIRCTARSDAALS